MQHDSGEQLMSEQACCNTRAAAIHLEPARNSEHPHGIVKNLNVFLSDRGLRLQVHPLLNYCLETVNYFGSLSSWPGTHPTTSNRLEDPVDKGVDVNGKRGINDLQGQQARAKLRECPRQECKKRPSQKDAHRPETMT